MKKTIIGGLYLIFMIFYAFNTTANELGTLTNRNITSVGLNSTIIIEGYIINYTKQQTASDFISFENLTYVHVKSCGIRKYFDLFNFTEQNQIIELPYDHCSDAEQAEFLLAHQDSLENPMQSTNTIIGLLRKFMTKIWSIVVSWIV